MRLASIVIGISASLSSVVALENLPDYVKKFPNCSRGALRDALEEADCKVDNINSDTFECMCNHLGSIPIAVANDVDVGCSADFSIAFGGVCGMWETQPSDKEKKEAAELFAEKIDANANSSSKPSDKESDKPDAAGAIRIPGIAELVGCVVAVAVGFMF